jgi:predicted NodU family carbamoyl transferase
VQPVCINVDHWLALEHFLVHCRSEEGACCYRGYREKHTKVETTEDFYRHISWSITFKQLVILICSTTNMSEEGCLVTLAAYGAMQTIIAKVICNSQTMKDYGKVITLFRNLAYPRKMSFSTIDRKS